MDALTTFFSAWSETDADKRKSLIASSCVPDIIYSDPRSGERLMGIDALSDYVGVFSANAPGWTAKIEASDEINGYIRAQIAFGGMGPDGAEMLQRGTYFSETNGDKLVMIAGFAGVSADV